MRQRSTFSLVAALLLILAIGSVAAASNHRGPGAGGQAFVGMWIVDADTADPEEPPALLTVSSDGSLWLSDCCSAPAAGVWAPSGRRTADATVLFSWADEEGFIGFNTLRAEVELSPDGETFTATYTVDLPTGDGSTSGQLGPATASGARVHVDLMGEPIGPIPDEDPSAGNPEGEPGASPSPGA